MEDRKFVDISYTVSKQYEKYYSEKIIRLPNCYQCNDDKKEICSKPIFRKDCNLPDKAFVFTCFCANKKITPKEYDIWMKLLEKTKGSVLWLYKSNSYSEKNFRALSPMLIPSIWKSLILSAFDEVIKNKLKIKIFKNIFI